MLFAHLSAHFWRKSSLRSPTRVVLKQALYNTNAGWCVVVQSRRGSCFTGSQRHWHKRGTVNKGKYKMERIAPTKTARKTNIRIICQTFMCSPTLKGTLSKYNLPQLCLFMPIRLQVYITYTFHSTQLSRSANNQFMLNTMQFPVKIFQKKSLSEWSAADYLRWPHSNGICYPPFFQAMQVLIFHSQEW